MISAEALRYVIETAQARQLSPALLQRLVSVMDLTSLNDQDTQASITTLCHKAITPLGPVAAVCIYPRFVRAAKQALINTGVKVATVANFPHGNDHLEAVLFTIRQALQEGAEEIDVVFPYQQYLAGGREAAQDFIQHCKATCGETVLLKVILETGAFPDLAVLAEAGRDVLLSGADFLKTSTGKITQGATLEGVATLLFVLKAMPQTVQRSRGIKISGGIREWATASAYLLLADEIMGNQWACAETFRIGTSRLVDDIP